MKRRSRRICDRTKRRLSASCYAQFARRVTYASRNLVSVLRMYANDSLTWNKILHLSPSRSFPPRYKSEDESSCQWTAINNANNCREHVFGGGKGSHVGGRGIDWLQTTTTQQILESSLCRSCSSQCYGKAVLILKTCPQQ